MMTTEDSFRKTVSGSLKLFSSTAPRTFTDFRGENNSVTSAIMTPAEGRPGMAECGSCSSYKPAHRHLGDFGGDCGVDWGTCKAGPNSEHNGGHSQKKGGKLLPVVARRVPG